jgi:nitroreductase
MTHSHKNHGKGNNGHENHDHEDEGLHEHSHVPNLSVQDFIRTRRSVRKYVPKDIPFDLVVQIMESAKYAPFAGNIMNFKIIVVKNESKRKAISEACSQQHWMADAPVHLVIVAEPEKIERFYGTRGIRLYSVQGIAAAIQNMLLTATELGVGSCWVGAFDEEMIRSTLNMPEHLDIHAVITLGEPAEKPHLPPRYRLEHYMFFDKWWGRQEHPKWGIAHWAPVIQKGVKETGKMVDRVKAGLFRKKEDSK